MFNWLVDDWRLDLRPVALPLNAHVVLVSLSILEFRSNHSEPTRFTLMQKCYANLFSVYNLTQASPHEFLTIQCSTPLSSTPQPLTETMWFD